MEQKQFSVFLLSNGDTKNVFNNRGSASLFTIPLADELRTDGEHWEVGLSEIFLPNFIYNISGEMQKIEVGSRAYDGNMTTHEITIPSGYYNGTSYADVFNKLITAKITVNKEPYKIKMEYDVATKKMSATIGINEFIQVRDKRLRIILGMDRDNDKMDNFAKFRTGHWEAFPFPCCFNVWVQQAYVYVDVQKYTFVGDMKAPLLRVVDLEHEARGNERIHRVFQSPYYFPVEGHVHKSITVKICDSTGAQLQFKAGTSLLALHFVNDE